MKIFKGFTLAEVLITLGIIGIVAAITIPLLIQNYQKTIYVNQLKKSLNILESGFNKAMADDTVFDLRDTELIKPILDKSTVDNDAFDNFVSKFKQYFKVVKTDYYTIYDNGDKESYKRLNSLVVPLGYARIILADGTRLFVNIGGNQIIARNNETCNLIKSMGGTFCTSLGTINIDVNGEKAPNVLGRDVFSFILADNGKLYPCKGKDDALFNNQIKLSDNNKYWKNDNLYGCVISSQNQGNGCAARIMENGWKMDY